MGTCLPAPSPPKVTQIWEGLALVHAPPCPTPAHPLASGLAAPQRPNLGEQQEQAVLSTSVSAEGPTACVEAQGSVSWG